MQRNKLELGFALNLKKQEQRAVMAAEQPRGATKIKRRLANIMTYDFATDKSATPDSNN